MGPGCCRRPAGTVGSRLARACHLRAKKSGLDHSSFFTMGTIDLRRFSGPQPLADAAADDCLSSISKVRPHDATFLMALSGGRIARTFCSALAEKSTSRGLSGQVHFFWSDERCVPPEDLESNFLLANE